MKIRLDNVLKRGGIIFRSHGSEMPCLSFQALRVVYPRKSFFVLVLDDAVPWRRIVAEVPFIGPLWVSSILTPSFFQSSGTPGPGNDWFDGEPQAPYRPLGAPKSDLFDFL